MIAANLILLAFVGASYALATNRLSLVSIAAGIALGVAVGPTVLGVIA